MTKLGSEFCGIKPEDDNVDIICKQELMKDCCKNELWNIIKITLMLKIKQDFKLGPLK
jgi:hypothetical protein